VRRWPTLVRIAALGVLGVLVATPLLAPNTADAAARQRTTRAPAAPKGPQCPRAGAHAASFAKVVSGTSFLTTDNIEIRLAGVLAADQDGQPLAASQSEAARSRLSTRLASGTLTYTADETARDRYGRLAAEVFVGGQWLQGDMVRTGELRSAPDRVSAACATLLLAAEDQARMERVGGWQSGAFALRTPQQIANRAGSFQIVEGIVQTATVNKGRGYINFGADYRDDFTVTVTPEDMKLFRQTRSDIRKLAGKHVRVRGWVELYHGPEMEIALPAAIETLP
jgi:endonuclease YncB( thermonuclease family)